jgi:hypothetical protein
MIHLWLLGALCWGAGAIGAYFLQEWLVCGIYALNVVIYLAMWIKRIVNERDCKRLTRMGSIV